MKNYLSANSISQLGRLLGMAPDLAAFGGSLVPGFVTRLETKFGDLSRFELTLAGLDAGSELSREELHDLRGTVADLLTIHLTKVNTQIRLCAVVPSESPQKSTGFESMMEALLGATSCNEEIEQLEAEKASWETMHQELSATWATVCSCPACVMSLLEFASPKIEEKLATYGTAGTIPDADEVNRWVAEEFPTLGLTIKIEETGDPKRPFVGSVANIDGFPPLELLEMELGEEIVGGFRFPG